MNNSSTPDDVPGDIDVVVCGAHLSGLPLNVQLTERGGRLVKTDHTTPDYRMYAIAGGPPYRPALVRVSQGGAALPVEVWRLHPAAFGEFVALIPAPLGMGKVQLSDGQSCCGFIAEPVALEGATDITHFGGWRNYISQTA